MLVEKTNNWLNKMNYDLKQFEIVLKEAMLKKNHMNITFKNKLAHQ